MYTYIRLAPEVDQIVDAIQARAKKEAGKGSEIKPVHVRSASLTSATQQCPRYYSAGQRTPSAVTR